MLGLALVVGLVAQAPFEGVLQYDVRVRNATGSVKTYVSKLGVRSEASLPFGETKNDVTVQVRAAEPDVTRLWDAAKKEFVVQPPQPMARTVTRVEALGEASVLGIKCKRVRLHEAEGWTDYCVAKDALKDAGSDRLVTKAQRLDAATVAALTQAGATGLIVKMMHMAKGAPDLEMELTSLQPKPVDAALMK